MLAGEAPAQVEERVLRLGGAPGAQVHRRSPFFDVDQAKVQADSSFECQVTAGPAIPRSAPHRPQRWAASRR